VQARGHNGVVETQAGRRLGSPQRAVERKNIKGYNSSHSNIGDVRWTIPKS
jgi:hypothetical protein